MKKIDNKELKPSEAIRLMKENDFRLDNNEEIPAIWKAINAIVKYLDLQHEAGVKMRNKIKKLKTDL